MPIMKKPLWFKALRRATSDLQPGFGRSYMKYSATPNGAVTAHHCNYCT